jgi:transcriptional antiterminator NusG
VDDQILQSEEKNNAAESAETHVPAPEPKAVTETPLEIVNEASDETRAPETDAAAETAAAPKPEGPKRSWYVVHCYSGYENKVKKGLEQRVKSMPPEQKMEELIFRAVVPTEEELDLREGQRKVIQRRVFPGYILVEMIMTEESWYVVRNTPGVTGFVSSGDKPTPLREDEVNKILKRMETEQPKVRVTYRPGQVVHIIDGPFADFRGTVDEVNMEKGKVRVMVSFFGRETPVELDLLQVQKV